jgi:S-DNA-T family DNA segregation ATPase FtsK/SpoIIIE
VSIDTTPIDWDLSKVIPGEVVAPEADDDEDIAPGVLEVRPSYPPVLRKAGGAAMVVAAATGKAIGITARAAWTGSVWFGAGFKAGCVLGWRYVRAHDHQEVLGGMSSGTDWNKVKQTRLSRWRFLGWTATATGLLNLVGWWAVTAWCNIPADTSWMVLPGIEAAAAAATVAAYGRYRLRAPDIAPQQVVADMDNPENEDPYPIAWVTSGGQAADCLARALFAEGADYRDVKTLARHAWGWELEVILKGSTPGKVQAAADQLESHMGLPDGGFMIEPDTRDKSRIVVRLVQQNPFADMPAPAVHAPRSLSVHDVITMGRAMDGSPFELTLDGLCALIIGAMGAGKTLGALRTINEALTACRDAVVWDLDPIKGGLAEFGDLMARRARTPEECEEALAEALDYVTARGQLMANLGMGDRWHATEKHPNLYINIDEFIQLSPRGKELAIKILRTGRQYGIYLIMAGQEATADALGDAIAMIVAYRILMACRFEDVRIAFGPGAGAQGWRPDRMKPAVGPVANDAGQAMIMGGPFVRAIRHQFNKYSRDQIIAAVTERTAAGMPTMDADTLLKAGAALSRTRQRSSLTDRLVQSDHDDAALILTLLRAFDTANRDYLPTNEAILPALATAGLDDIDATALATRLRKHAPGVKAGREDCLEGKHLRGWHRTSVEQAAAGLLDPAKTRQNPGTTPA